MAYTPIEYIQSNGNQYIDTGYHANDKTKIEILLSNSSSSACYPFGSRDDTWLGKEYSVTIDTAYVFQYKGAAVYTQVIPKQADLIITDIPNITVNNVQFSETIPDSYNCEKSMYIFALNKYGSAYKFSEMKLYYMKIWDDGTLVFDLIPVLDENNVACLYNKVAGTYLYNAGTDEFIAGNVIANPVITIGTPSRTKISAISGHDQSTVTFQSDIALQSWEARATLQGITPAHGVGLLVESGGSLEANTDATVYVDDEELTQGDLEYTISIFGLSTEGRWSDG